MRLSIVAFMLMAAFLMSTASAVETTLKGTAYIDWMMDLSDGAENYNRFGIGRAYFTAASKFSDYTSVQLTLDIKPDLFITSATTVVDNDGDTVRIPAMDVSKGYPFLLKFAYADWKIKPLADMLKLRIGLQPTIYLAYVDELWMRRYIERNVYDIAGWLSTADLGATAYLSFGPKGQQGTIGLEVLNGTKFSDIAEKNKNKDINLFARIDPFHENPNLSSVSIGGQYYMGTQNVSLTADQDASNYKNNILSVGGRVGYRKLFDLCFDWSSRTYGMGAGNEDLKSSAISGWMDIYLNELFPEVELFKTLGLFGRYDIYDPNTDLDDDGNNTIFAGLECTPVKGVKAALNYRQVSYQADGVDAGKYLFLSTEFKF